MRAVGDHSACSGPVYGHVFQVQPTGRAEGCGRRAGESADSVPLTVCTSHFEVARRIIKNFMCLYGRCIASPHVLIWFNFLCFCSSGRCGVDRCRITGYGWGSKVYYTGHTKNITNCTYYPDHT